MAKVFISPIGVIEAPQIPSAPPNPLTGRMPVKHLLLGTPPAVTHTIHRLHQIRYAEANDWSTLLVLPDRQIILAPDEGDVVAMLVRYLNIQ